MVDGFAGVFWVSHLILFIPSFDSTVFVSARRAPSSSGVMEER